MLTEQDHVRFLRLAQHISSWSPDPSTKVGCILVDQDGHIVSSGFNAFPRDEEHDEAKYNIRSYKYKHIRHAEDECLQGFAHVIDGSHTLYTTHPPCEHCAGLIIGHGVKKVVSCIPSEDFESRWLNSTLKASEIFEIGKVNFVKYSLDK